MGVTIYSFESVIANVDREFACRHPGLKGKRLKKRSKTSLRKEWNELFLKEATRTLGELRDEMLDARRSGGKELAIRIDLGA